ncbi:MAG: hypothetical protein HOH74_12450 [Gemmatimonadetes bacterium]|jgi:NADH:ubiquinone oxidoreductase subunit K|nr:hypothetical protein [Gemmatimonadota bacterium]MBT6146238.1 hypothetical protein [Gemmatimonadota bacterium]
MAWESTIVVALLAGLGLVSILASRHRLSLLVGSQLLSLAAVRALAAAGQRELAMLSLVFAVIILLIALRLGQDAEAAEQPPEPPP